MPASGGRAAPVSALDRVLLRVLVVSGVLLAARFADWWFRPGHVGEPVLFVALSLALWYGIGRLVLGWIAVPPILGVLLPWLARTRTARFA